jgi:hypothetical protein
METDIHLLTLSINKLIDSEIQRSVEIYIWQMNKNIKMIQSVEIMK